MPIYEMQMGSHADFFLQMVRLVFALSTTEPAPPSPKRYLGLAPIIGGSSFWP